MSLTDTTLVNLNSDVYIFHSSDLISLFRLKMASKEVTYFNKNSQIVFLIIFF